MVKLKENLISKDDILEYLETYSDFSFEVKVLRYFSSIGYNCQHSGTYEDPVTGKTREFDVRAVHSKCIRENFYINICFAIECKNIRGNFPLVIHCMPRENDECYLDLIWSSHPASYHSIGRCIKLKGSECPYMFQDPTGKSCDQVGRQDNKDSRIVGSDYDVFDKISQAINSSYDLIVKGHKAYYNKNANVVTLVVPVLVVPDDRLWTVWYSRSGEIEREPAATKNVEYFIGKKFEVKDNIGVSPSAYKLSHLEIVQISDIGNMVRKYRELPAITDGAILGDKLINLPDK